MSEFIDRRILLTRLFEAVQDACGMSSSEILMAMTTPDVTKRKQVLRERMERMMVRERLVRMDRKSPPVKKRTHGSHG